MSGTDHASFSGRRFAELELYTLLIKMLPKYQLSTKVENLKIKQKLVVMPSEPLQMCFSKRVEK